MAGWAGVFVACFKPGKRTNIGSCKSVKYCPFLLASALVGVIVNRNVCNIYQPVTLSALIGRLGSALHTNSKCSESGEIMANDMKLLLFGDSAKLHPVPTPVKDVSAPQREARHSGHDITVSIVQINAKLLWNRHTSRLQHGHKRELTDSCTSPRPLHARLRKGCRASWASNSRLQIMSRSLSSSGR